MCFESVDYLTGASQTQQTSWVLSVIAVIKVALLPFSSLVCVFCSFFKQGTGGYLSFIQSFRNQKASVSDGHHQESLALNIACISPTPPYLNSDRARRLYWLCDQY